MAKFKFFSVGGESDTDTNTNLANTDLSNSATRTFDINGNTLTFENGGTNIIQLDNSDDTLKIGGATPYEMPNSKPTKQYMSLVAEKTTSNTSWAFQQCSSAIQMSANIGTIADNDHEIIGNGVSFDAGNLDNMTFADMSAIPPLVASGQQDQLQTLVYFSCTIAMTETGIGKGGCLFGATFGGSDGDTDFDLSSQKITLSSINVAGTTNQLKTSSGKLTAPLLADRKYWFYIENQSGASFTNVYVWINVYTQLLVIVN